MRVLISGGGIGGLALGAFLRECEIEYDIVEKCKDWTHQGYLVAVWDNGRDMLQKLRLAERFDRAGSRVQRYAVLNGKGEVLRNHYFAEMVAKYGGASTIVGRADVHQLLLEKAGENHVRMGIEVKTLVQTKDGVHVVFSDGTGGTYDVVVGADGVHSYVRSLAFGPGLERYTNQRVWYAWIDNAFDTPGVAAEYLAPGELCVVFGTGHKTLANFIAPMDHTLWDKTEGRVQTLKTIFKDERIAQEALNKLRDEDLMPTDLVDIDLKLWVQGRIVLVGDAAHSFGPIAGMGCSMAMEDAYVLSGELLKVVRAQQTLEAALHHYNKVCHSRVEEVKKLTRMLRRGLLVRSPFARKVIDLCIPWAPKFFATHHLEALLKKEI